MLAACGTESDDSVGAVKARPAAYPTVDESFLSASDWRFIGPYRGGRVLAVAGTVDDPLVHYFGAAHGGVWKTTDAGLNWRNVSDDYFEFPSVGALDVAFSDTDVIYVGTGEGVQRQFISPGNGVYKSTDGGDTWSHVGLEATRHIARLRIHPSNPDIAFVAAMGDQDVEELSQIFSESAARNGASPNNFNGNQKRKPLKGRVSSSDKSAGE